MVWSLLIGCGCLWRTTLFGGHGRALFQQLLEAVNPASRVYQVLFAGVEGMAIRTDFHVNRFDRGTDIEHLAAGTGDCGRRKIGWMRILLHRTGVTVPRLPRVGKGEGCRSNDQ